MGEHNSQRLVAHILSLLEGNNANAEDEQFPQLAEQIKSFIREIPGGFLIYRAYGDEEIIYANTALIRMTGCTTLEEFKEFTGNSFKGIVHPDDLDTVEKSIEQQIASSQYDLDYVEYRINHKYGQVCWIEDYGHLIRDKEIGDYFYVFLSDATEKIEHRLAERANLINQKYENEKRILSLIQEYDDERKTINQEHLRRLEIIEALSYNYNSIFYVDLDACEIIPYRVNQHTKEQFDEDLNRRDYNAFARDYVESWIHPDDKELVQTTMRPQTIRTLLASDRAFYINYRCVHHNEQHNIQMRIVAVGEGRSQIVIGIHNIDDMVIQEQRQKQVLEEALETARQADTAKNIFLSNMSHDMRTPLNAIFGYSKLAQNYLDDPETVTDYLNKIQSAGASLLEMTERVLEISYTGSQTRTITETKCDLLNIMDRVGNAMRKKAAAKQHNFETDYDGVKTTEVIVDGEKLEQVLTQLADNAVKYTKPGGKISLKLTEEVRRPNGFVRFRFAVSDTGIGISKEKLPTIFDPFERDGTSTSSGVFGSGLGLTIAKNFIEAMGGSIEAESELGKGSVFTVTLDLRAATDSEELDNDATILSEIRGKKILIVEDNELNLEIETEMLEDLGFSVESAENGKIAIDKLIYNPDDYYAIILMDIQMPVMDGRQASRIIRNFENPVISNIPIIAVSANAFESDKLLSAKAGIDAHLPKPLDIDLLLETMTKVVYSKRKAK